MKSVFKNHEEGRLKAGWRILLFVFTFWGLTATVFAVKPLFDPISKREFLQDYSLLIITILAISATIAVRFARKKIDKRDLKSLGFKWTDTSLKDLLFGFFLSAAMAGVFFGLLLMFGLINFEGIQFEATNFSAVSYIEFISVLTLGSLALMLLEHILVGYWEELVFRGYLFRNMVDGMGLKISIIVSCLIYGLLHSTNPNATLLSSGIIVVFGFMRIYGLLTTKVLWLSMGMHMGWNFFQGPIFGFGASGHKHTALFVHTPNGADFLTGGAFGPEGSLLIVPILFAVIYSMKKWSIAVHGNETVQRNYA